nr:cytochrome c oxidase assembly factor 6 homolog [Misgurnus anguillicaudatus]XP_055046829.1 cytochrome c oxidase assembly factor 6 homolog [Misgurnus anguillicaudatus]XP_055046830.1 cytochrome c oxidase assembly factor 6 homolog [Misgurnus anguillicaudatus]XP_055046831.1 cytochrome c oxidase assembly factor 6 homolog [Misgurnus anguillicaudatus]
MNTEMSAPNASERKACWGARDDLWKCLDVNQDETSACGKQLKEFESKCPAQWVKYFSKRRDFLKYKDKIENEGYEPTEGAPKL